MICKTDNTHPFNATLVCWAVRLLRPEFCQLKQSLSPENLTVNGQGGGDFVVEAAVVFLSCEHAFLPACIFDLLTC